MPETSTASLMRAATTTGRAIAAFNVITLEHAEAIAAAAERAAQPVIMQLSENAIRYHGAVGPLASALHALASAARTPVALHLDHIEDEELLHHGVEAGFGSVMFDAGRLPYDANVSRTRTVAKNLRSLGIFTEAELGYVAATEVDALAVAVGSSHAMTEQTAALDLALIERLRDRVPVPLVLHGSSGVPDLTLQAAIRAGITKVNIGTALNVAFTAALKASLAANDTVDPRKHLEAARARTADAVEQMLLTIATA
jgi:fructose-bisphosphate aldolase class II